MRLIIVGEIMADNADSLEYAMARAEAEIQSDEAQEKLEQTRDLNDWLSGERQRLPEFLHRFIPAMASDCLVALEFFLSDAPYKTVEEKQQHIDAAMAELGMQILNITPEVYLFPVFPFSGYIKNYDPLRKHYAILKPGTVEPTEESVIGPLEERVITKLAEYVTYPVAEVVED